MIVMGNFAICPHIVFNVNFREQGCLTGTV